LKYPDSAFPMFSSFLTAIHTHKVHSNS
jgi:hypothetical protein